MRHPFDGITVPAPAEAAPAANRRSWLKGLLGALAGLFVWKTARAQVKIEIAPAVPVDLPVIRGPVVIGPDGRPIAVGGAGGGPGDPEPYDPRMSTAVRGEEGASVTG